MRDKLARYSLAMRHPDGGPKAFRFRELLGITLADLDHLAAAIEHGLPLQPVTRVLRYVRDRPRLVTAYIGRR